VEKVTTINLCSSDILQFNACNWCDSQFNTPVKYTENRNLSKSKGIGVKTSKA